MTKATSTTTARRAPIHQAAAWARRSERQLLIPECTAWHRRMPNSGHRSIAAAEVWMRQDPTKKGMMALSAMAARARAPQTDVFCSRAATTMRVRARRQHSIDMAMTAGQVATAMQ